MAVRVAPLADDIVDTRDPFEADADTAASKQREVSIMAQMLAELVCGEPYSVSRDAYHKACWQLVADVRREQNRER